MIFSLVTALFLLSAAAYAGSSASSTNSDPSFSFHGFISTSFFWQNQDFAFGNGQNAEWPEPNTGSNHDLSGFDVRNTRAWIDFTGVNLSDGWTISGHLEGDFFGGFNGTGPTARSRKLRACVRRL